MSRPTVYYDDSVVILKFTLGKRCINPETLSLIHISPGRYVGIEEVEDDGEPFEEKMDRLTKTLSEQFKKSKELEDEIRKQLGGIGYELQ